MKHKYKILFMLFVISFLASMMLSFSQTEQLLCSIGSGCDIVHASPYNYTFGIQNSYFGIPIFFILSLVTLSQILRPKREKKKVINIAVVLASVVVLYFLYVQAFLLHAWCKYCLTVDISTVLALAITIIGWRD